MSQSNLVVQQSTFLASYVPTIADTWITVRTFNIPTIVRPYVGYVQVEVVGTTNAARLAGDQQQWRLLYSDGTTTASYTILFTATPASPSQLFHTFRLLADAQISTSVVTVALQCNSFFMSAPDPIAVRAQSFFVPRTLIMPV